MIAAIKSVAVNWYEKLGTKKLYLQIVHGSGIQLEEIVDSSLTQIPFIPLESQKNQQKELPLMSSGEVQDSKSQKEF